MCRKKVLVLLFLWVAAICAACADEGFYAVKDNTDKIWPGIAYATSEITDGAGAMCSSVVTSNDGYVLTAAHCVKHCLFQNGIAHNDTQLWPNDIGFLTSGQLQQSLSCPGLSLQTGSHVLPLQIVAVGPGVTGLVAKFTDFDTMSPETFNQLASLNGDFAVLKAAIPQGQHFSYCIPFRTTSLETGEEIYLTGFPNATNRSEGLNSDGSSEYISQGQVSSNFDDNAALLGDHLDAKTTSRVWDFIRQANQVVTSLDSYAGDSGGPVTDQKNSLVGIANAPVEVDGAKTHYSSSNTIITPVTYIQQYLNSSIGSDLTRDIFSCKVSGQ